MTRFILLALTTLIACSAESKDEDAASDTDAGAETEPETSDEEEEEEEEEEETIDCTYEGFEAGFVGAYYNGRW